MKLDLTENENMITPNLQLRLYKERVTVLDRMLKDDPGSEFKTWLERCRTYCIEHIEYYESCRALIALN